MCIAWIPWEIQSLDSRSAAPPASDACRRNPDSEAGIYGTVPQAEEEEETMDLQNPPSISVSEEVVVRIGRKRARVLEREKSPPFFFFLFEWGWVCAESEGCRSSSIAWMLLPSLSRSLISYKWDSWQRKQQTEAVASTSLAIRYHCCLHHRGKNKIETRNKEKK